MKHKVCIIIDTAFIGGPGKGLLMLLDKRYRQDFEYLICTFDYSQRGGGTEFVEALRENNIPYRLIQHRSKFDFSPLWSILQIVKEEGCTIIQTHNYKPHFFGYLTSRIRKLPWVAVEHGFTDTAPMMHWYNKMTTFLLAKAERVITVAPSLFSYFEKRRSGKPTAMIPNAVDKQFLKQATPPLTIRERYGLSEDTIVFGCFGRFSKEKGHSLLIDAFNILKMHNNWHLLLVGSGHEEEAIKDKVHSLGLNEKISFCGYCSTMKDYYEAIDVLLISSFSEGLPNVLLEAMSCGKPALATKVGAIELVLRDKETGWLIDAGEVTQFTEALTMLLSFSLGRTLGIW